MPAPAEGPDPALELAREQLDAARGELREASRTIALLALPGGVEPGPLYRTRRELELKVAEYRLKLWSDEVRRLESVVRSLGARP